MVMWMGLRSMRDKTTPAPWRTQFDGKNPTWNMIECQRTDFIGSGQEADAGVQLQAGGFVRENGSHMFLTFGATLPATRARMLVRMSATS